AKMQSLPLDVHPCESRRENMKVLLDDVRVVVRRPQDDLEPPCGRDVRDGDVLGEVQGVIAADVHHRPDPDGNPLPKHRGHGERAAAPPRTGTGSPGSAAPAGAPQPPSWRASETHTRSNLDAVGARSSSKSV